MIRNCTEQTTQRWSSDSDPAGPGSAIIHSFILWLPVWLLTSIKLDRMDVKGCVQPYCDALHVQLFEVKHTAQDGLLVPCLQGYGIPIQGELTQGMQFSKAGYLIPTNRQKEELRSGL